MSNPKDKKYEGKDIIVPNHANSDGSLCVTRYKPDNTVEIGIAKPCHDGEIEEGYDLAMPLGDGTFEIVKETFSSTKKPAKVNSAKFRKGWDQVFSQKGGSA